MNLTFADFCQIAVTAYVAGIAVEWGRATWRWFFWAGEVITRKT